MSTIALPIPDFSRMSTFNYALPTNLNSSGKTTSHSRIFCSLAAISARNCFSKSGSFEKNEVNPLIRPRAAAIDEGGGAVFDFGEFEAREACEVEEYWAAAWLRAECYWEGREHERNADNFKWLYAEKEFVALKNRCDVQLGNNCKCIVMVKKEEADVEAKSNTIMDRLVGTLEFRVQYFSPGQTFPDEHIVRPPFGPINRRASNSYGHILNLCVAKSSRRRGMATGMLHYAISAAKERGIKKVFLRVYGYNEAAVALYEKVGFKVVEEANCSNCSALPLLLCFEA